MQFLYVFNKKDKAKLISLGYRLFKEDVDGSTYVFVEEDSMKFEDPSVEFVRSKILTF